MAQSVEIFGRGMLCPVQRDGKGDFANSSGIKVLKSDVSECIGIIGPIGNSAGELPWDGSRGSGLHRLRHRKVHSEMVKAQAHQYSTGVINQFEPRVRTGPTTVLTGEEGAESTELRIQVTFVPKGFPNARPETVETPLLS